MKATGVEKAKLVQETTRSERQQHRYEEQRWVATEGQKYVGQWVVVEGDQLFGVDTDGKALYDRARAEGIECPFIVRIPTPATEPFGGW